MNIEIVARLVLVVFVVLAAISYRKLKGFSATRLLAGDARTAALNALLDSSLKENKLAFALSSIVSVGAFAFCLYAIFVSA